LKVTEIYYGALHDKQELILLYLSVKEKVNTREALSPKSQNLLTLPLERASIIR
jgi:hypothetical protein